MNRRRLQGHGARVAAFALLLLPPVAFGQALPANPGKDSASSPAHANDASAEVRVEGSRPAPLMDLNVVEQFDSAFVTRTDAFTADEVLSNIAPGLPGTQQLVLIDGRETLIDLSTLPAEMIARIEVSTSGVMPDGRPRAAGNVINIILKEKYNGANVSARQRESSAGGGAQNQFTASGGYSVGSFDGRFNATHREQNALLASERDYSRNQNHAPEGGADYRLQYGTPAVVQALAGSLNGVVDSTGAPVSVALVPDALPDHGITPPDFIPAPAGTESAAGLRRFNTSDFLYLAAPTEVNVANGELGYAATPNLKLRGGFTVSRSESRQSSPPPVTPVSAASLVPAALNPFGQDVEVGLVHSGFGPVPRETSVDRHSEFLSAEGHFAETWAWNGRFETNHRDSSSETHDLDPAKFAASLQALDPAERFDPFADVSAGSANAALYPSLTRVRRSVGVSEDTRLHLDSHGQVSPGWIAPVMLRVGVDRTRNDSRQNLDASDSAQPDVNARSRVDSLRLNANLDIPVFKIREVGSPAVLSMMTYISRDRQRLDDQPTTTTSSAQPVGLEINTLSLNNVLSVPWIEPADARPGVYQLATEVGVGFVRSASATNAIETLGALWSPLKPLTLRADYSRQTTPTPITLYPITVDDNQTLIDRRRNDPLADGVRVISNQPDVRSPALSSRLQLSLELVPPALEKLKVTLTYAAVEQEGQQRFFSAQDILDNEGALPGRVTRLPPTAEDIAAGEPGEIVQVDATPFSGGRREDRTLALLMQYSATGPRIGTVTLRASAQHLISSTNELVSGTQIVSTNDQESPPGSKVWAQANWQRGSWEAGATFTRSGRGRYAGIPYSAFASLDTRLIYQIDEPFGGRFVSNLRIGAGIQNLFDADPPFADTLSGFRGGSPFGRTYELTLRAPLGE